MDEKEANRSTGINPFMIKRISVKRNEATANNIKLIKGLWQF